MAGENEIALKLALKVEEAKTVGELKSTIKEIKNELLNVEAGSDAFVTLQKAAGKAKGEMSEINEQIAALDTENKTGAFLKLGAGIAGGFEAAQGAMALFGAESENIEKQLLKVQAAAAFANGIKEVSELGKSFKNVGTIIGQSFTQMKEFGVKAFTSIKGAIAATGIGLVVVALGAIVAYWDDIKGAVSGVSKEQEDLLKKEKDSVAGAEKKLQSIDKQSNILKEQGKSEREILQMKIKASDEAIKGLEAQLITQEEVKKSQVETSERNKTILQNIIRLVTAPITLLLKGIDMAGAAFGKNFNLEEKFSGGIAGMLFDPEEVRKEADAGIEETRNKLEELKNQRAGFNLSIQEMDKKAYEKRLEDAKKYAEEIKALQEQERLDEIKNLENKLQEEKNLKTLTTEDAIAYEDKIYALQREKEGLKYEELEALRIEHEQKIRDIKAQSQAEADAAINKDIADEVTMLDIKLQNIKTAGELTTQAEIDVENQKFELLKEQKNLSYEELQKLEADHKAKLKDLNDKADEEAETARQKRFDAIYSSMQNSLQAASILADSFIKDEKKREAFKKKLALTEIGINTAIAIASTVNGASKEFKKGLPGIPLGIAVLTTGLLTVATNIAKAKSLLQSDSGSVPTSGGGGGGVPTGTEAPDLAKMAEANTGKTNLDENGTPVVKAVVVETDITNTQSRVKSIQEKASI